MKYVRNRMNYFRQDNCRIENTKEFRSAVKEQNDNEPIPTAEVSDRITIILLSILVVIVIVGIIFGGIKFINSMENPDRIFENKVVLYCFFGVFCFIGILFGVIPIIKGLILKYKCTQELYATCIGYDDVIVANKHGAHFESCPVYKFNDAGTEYIVYNKKYTRDATRLPDIGSVVPILLNPEDPNSCIINNKVAWNIKSIIVGACFLLLAFVFYVGVFNGM